MRLKITVDGKAYDVEVEVAEADVATGVRYVGGGGNGGGGGARPMAAPSSGGGGGREVADEANALRSPLAGVVSEVKVGVGDTVEADQEVIVLEAMKMFTTITAPRAGTVKALEVAKGDAVKQGALLLEFE